MVVAAKVVAFQRNKEKGSPKTEILHTANGDTKGRPQSTTLFARREMQAPTFLDDIILHNYETGGAGGVTEHIGDRWRAAILSEFLEYDPVKQE